MFGSLVGSSEENVRRAIQTAESVAPAILWVDEIDKAFANMSQGGKVVMPLADQFWGAKFGMLIDKFGMHWMFNCELPKK